MGQNYHDLARYLAGLDDNVRAGEIESQLIGLVNAKLEEAAILADTIALRQGVSGIGQTVRGMKIKS